MKVGLSKGQWQQALFLQRIFRSGKIFLCLLLIEICKDRRKKEKTLIHISSEAFPC